jgi:ABC-type dipeptide/oligopeptide/nickel transport system ATPase subunit
MVLINKSGHIKAIKVKCSVYSHSWGFNHLNIRIPQAMEIGSDDEKALTKSIQMCFPEAERSLCTKHLKDNVSEYLKNKIGINNSERHNVVEKIFGNAGVLDIVFQMFSA